jgi:hypothetical protein
MERQEKEMEMNPSETMTWAGPLPTGDEPGCIDTMTYAGPLTPIAVERAVADPAEGGPILWAGPLPSWMERGGGKALTFGPSFSSQAVPRM